MTAPLALAVVGSINVDLTARTARLPEPGLPTFMRLPLRSSNLVMLASLRDRAARTRDGLPGHGFDTGPIDLGSEAALPQGYQAGCVLSRTWDAGAPDPDGFEAALARMLDLYRALA